MTPLTGRELLAGRLATSARDARQAEDRVRRLYPYAWLLAEIHARVAEKYEEALEELKREIEQEGGAR